MLCICTGEKKKKVHCVNFTSETYKNVMYSIVSQILILAVTILACDFVIGDKIFKEVIKLK